MTGSESELDRRIPVEAWKPEGIAFRCRSVETEGHHVVTSSQQEEK